jgi:hypothetical protein
MVEITEAWTINLLGQIETAWDVSSCSAIQEITHILWK